MLCVRKAVRYSFRGSRLGPSPPPFALIVDLSAYCTGCWMERYADTCDTCEGKLDLNGNCETCITAARIAAADPCFICKEPMCYIEGRFSGRTFDCNGGNVIHRECEQAYREFVAPKCFFCSGPLCQVPNRFSGKKRNVSTGSCTLSALRTLGES